MINFVFTDFFHYDKRTHFLLSHLLCQQRVNNEIRISRQQQAAEELDRLSKTMGYMEKGMIRVRGLLEGEAPEAPVPAMPAAANVEEPAAPQETEA